MLMLPFFTGKLVLDDVSSMAMALRFDVNSSFVAPRLEKTITSPNVKASARVATVSAEKNAYRTLGSFTAHLSHLE
jgi:hypothetical protein